jgi:hypothetical protein
MMKLVKCSLPETTMGGMSAGKWVRKNVPVNIDQCLTIAACTHSVSLDYPAIEFVKDKDNKVMWVYPSNQTELRDSDMMKIMSIGGIP